MTLPLFLQGLGSVGVFASRAFLPAFVTAILLRFGHHAPGLARFGLIPHLRDVPTWFTSDGALVVLGVLAALELAAERFPEAREILDRVHGHLKAGMAALTYLGVLGASDRAAVGPMIREAGMFDALPALAIAAGTFLASGLRGEAIGLIRESDEDDDLGLQRLLRWAGDLSGGLGPFALIVFPILTVIAFGLAWLGLVALEKVAEARADRAIVPCAHCGRPIHPSALFCPSCRGAAGSPRDVNLLGWPSARAADPASLPDRLISVRRCPRCATRLTRKAVRQVCPACGLGVMDDPRAAADYIASIDRRVPLACLGCFLMGLVPVLGLIPGVIYYRLAIVAPFRRYLPPGRAFLVRWGVRLATLVLVGCQWVPVAGGLAVPSIALIHYFAYRDAYRRVALATPGSSEPV